MISGFIVLLITLACVADLTKCHIFNDELCIVRPTIIDMKPVELKYYPFMISLNKYTVISKNMCSRRSKGHKF